MQSPTHTYASIGNYTVTLYVENLNKSWDELNRSITLNTMSLADNSATFFQLFPNPTNNNVTISLPNLVEKVNYQIIDFSGKIVKENSVQNCKEFTIEISDFANGLYFIKLNSNESNAITKIIKN